MADKEATIYIVDVGQSMGRTRHDRDQSDLDWSLTWFWDKVTTTVGMGRKTLFVGVLGLGTDKTKNHMSEDESYKNITIIQALQPMLMPELRELPPKLKPSNTDRRDAMSAIILAVDMIMRHCKQLLYKKKIVLLTNATGRMDPSTEDIVEVAHQVKTNNINLTILGVDFDDPEYGFKEEEKPSIKATNEKLLKSLADQSGGTFATMQEAIEGMAIPFVKPVRPVPTYKGQLLLGDPSAYESGISIDIERYFKVSVKRPPTASTFIVPTEPAKESNDKPEPPRMYHVPDPNQPNQNLDLSREDLAKGYEYGRTAVHISESDENITKLETDAGYSILGFIPMENIERYLVLENSNIIVAQRGNDKAALALSSLVRALFEIDSCAVARLVKKDMTEPQLTLLTPLVNDQVQCLVENILPFAEDLRQYRFSPLDKIVTVSGKNLSSHRNLPNDDLTSAMSDFVDNMSLMDETERLSIEDTYNPVNVSVDNAIKHRAIHQDDHIPSLPQSFLNLAQPPPDLIEESQSTLDKLIKAADVKKVPPKVKGRKRYREVEKPLSGLDVEALFRKEQRKRISPDNAIPEFKQMVEASTSEEIFETVVKQMEGIIRNQIKNSFGSSKYETIIEELGLVREEIIEHEMPKIYNELIRKLKDSILSEELGTNRKELWWKIRVKKLGLIDTNSTDVSDVSPEQAEEFFH